MLQRLTNIFKMGGLFGLDTLLNVLIMIWKEQL